MRKLVKHFQIPHLASLTHTHTHTHRPNTNIDQFNNFNKNYESIPTITKLNNIINCVYDIDNNYKNSKTGEKKSYYCN